MNKKGGNMIKAVVLDVDGTLFDTENLDVIAYGEVGKRYGYDITKEILTKAIGMNHEDSAKCISSHFDENFNFSKIVKEADEYKKEYMQLNGIPLKKGARELLDFLQEKEYKIGVATSTRRNLTEERFDQVGFMPYFDEIVCGDDLEKGKPNPEIYLKTCEKLEVKPEEAVAIEDSKNGILAAESAGMQVIMVPDLVEPTEELLTHVDVKLPDLLEVILWLKNREKNVRR